MGAERRRHKVTVVLNDQEYEQVSLKAELTPFTISEYCRKAALRHQVREALSHEAQGPVQNRGESEQAGHLAG